MAMVAAPFLSQVTAATSKTTSATPFLCASLRNQQNLHVHPAVSPFAFLRRSRASSPTRLHGFSINAASIAASNAPGPGQGDSRPTFASVFKEEVLPSLSGITPLVAVRWTSIAAFALTLARGVCAVLFLPQLWMYFSWFFVIWPLHAAVALGIWSLVAAVKQSKKKAKEWEQVLVLAGALTWIILVPLGLRNGYIEGWPLLLFFTYMYFFLIGSIIRLRKHGELSPRSEDKQWSTSLSRSAQVAFIVAIVAGHWLAAYEGPLVYFAWNLDWRSLIAVAIIALATVVHYSATYFLGKYFDRLVKPKSLVIFGPYRIVRHPIYASYMLLFAGYCIALRAYWSMAVLVLACVLYYEQRVKLEETLLEEAFGEQYKIYRDKVKYKYIPYVY